MELPSCTAAFFDIGGTLAFVQVSADGDHLDQLAVYPGVGEILKKLDEKAVRLGILSDPAGVSEEEILAALQQAEILSLFDPSLILFGSKSSSRLFRRAAALVAGREGCRDARLLFVGEDAGERAEAGAAGFRAAPHPVLALPMLMGDAALRYLRIRVPNTPVTKDWRAVLRDLTLVPICLTAEPEGGTVATIYAIADTATAARLDDLGFWVDRLGRVDEPQTSEIYLLRDDKRAEGAFLEPTGNSVAFFSTGPDASRVLASTPQGLLVSIPVGESVERFHFEGTRHGHSLKPVPTVTLLRPDAPGFAAAGVAGVDVPLCTREKRVLASITDAVIRPMIDRYAGVGPVPEATRILSRHVHHPGNTLAVEALVDDLCTITPGHLTVRRHCFTHRQRKLVNVVATLPAAGMEGENEVVVVSAHLDSTAQEDPPYCGSTHPAPGADDDASGIAGVLAAAAACAELAPLRQRRREIRFVLFNAEEDGMAGSDSYAKAQAALEVKIVAAFQMDMIGFDREPPPHFELHAGFDIPEIPNAPEVRARSAELAGLIERLREEVSPSLPKPQIFSGLDDPAAGRSDHTSFHFAGYPACLATEDFFPGHGELGERSPHYHRKSDVPSTVNPRYAADIARLVAAAAWVVATR